jgi:uncharacterized membrane protein YraQ (UPF0718 family)
MLTSTEILMNFTTVLLGIVIEAVPFLLLGTVASGLVEVFVRREDVLRIFPRNPVIASLMGGVLGLVFPVCECGVVPLTRRLFNKGLPISAGIVFLLAAPIVNPVVIASTYAAYGWGRILIARIVLGFAVACIIGIIFSFNTKSSEIMRPDVLPQLPEMAGEIIPLESSESPGARLGRAYTIAINEFFEMGLYLIIGSGLAALLQTFIPQAALLAIGSGPVRSVLVMQALAYTLSVCSTVDAFLSLAFVNTFTTGSILTFLVFGPMVDIKSTLMFLGMFQRRIVLYLILLPLMLTMLIGIFINLDRPW